MGNWVIEKGYYREVGMDERRRDKKDTEVRETAMSKHSPDVEGLRGVAPPRE